MNRVRIRSLIRIVAILWPAVLLSFAAAGNPSLAATLNGVVTNSLTGTGIIGARITVNGASTWSVSAGVYSLNIDPPGTYTVTCSKAGYTTFTSAPVTFTQGSTVVINIQLSETPNSPVNATAVLDTALQTVHVNWQPPVGTYELLYDDGIQDNFTVWATQGNMNGVRFTPPGYPLSVTGGSINIGTISNYPPGSNPLVPFQVAVYNASGPGGMPGTLIGGPFDIIPAHFGWVEFTFPTPVAINSGNFYLVMIQGGNTPDAAGLAVDETNPQLRSVQRFVQGSGQWIPAGGNFLIRAIAEGPGGPVLLTDNGDALVGYNIWRLRQGEEQNPMVWTDLGPATEHYYNDQGWFSFPCGPYIWGIKAQYSGNQWSPVCFSNILPKCWTSGVTVNTQLTCDGGDKSGTGVRLTNMVYPDTTYFATLDTSGSTLFPHVWKGTYELDLVKFGYQEQMLTLPVSHDTAITAMLLQNKPSPRELEVNEKSLVAHWQVPEYKEGLFAEDWSSAGFAANGWTAAGGYNWVVSTVVGNPAPSVMFGWSPQVTSYSQTLTSREIDTRNAPVLLLNYDISLDNFGTTTENIMAVEVWDGSSWTTIASYSNATGSMPWLSVQKDISSFSGTPMKIRFHATGGDSYDINGWFIDNITVEGSETQPGLTNCILGYNVYLDNVLSGFTTETKYTIPGTQVQYGQTYDLCVNAAYGSGWSDNTCVSFTSGFLWPPRDPAATVIEDAVELTWYKPEMPDTGGQMVTPPGLLGYRIYRNSVLLDSISGPDTLSYYDMQMEPGTYNYEITATYDLTDYGYPGQVDESMPAGPVTATINFGRSLPFFEPWDLASFSYNDWQFEPSQGNWFVNTSEGLPAPTAEFTWDPPVTDYKSTLISPPLDGSPYHCGKVWLEFDLALALVEPTGQEQLTVELFYDDDWHNLVTFTNDSAFDWIHHAIDITEVEGKGFKVGFMASGSKTADLVYWRLDNINVHAICFGPTDLQADVLGYDVHLTWRPPDCTGSNMYLLEGFEGEQFPPESWSQVITDPASTWSQMNALSPVGVHAGNYSAGVLWDYVHQDEWLIAGNVIVNGNLQFWSYAYQGSTHLDHYYVRISTDEGYTWTTLLDLSALPPYPGPGGYNQWNEPYTVDLSAYLNDIVWLAWQAVDGDGQGLWYSWAIDDCYIGSKKLQPVPSPAPRHLRENGPGDNLVGYDIYRRDGGATPFQKINTGIVVDTSYVDPGLNAGQYEYYISPVFTECTETEKSDTALVDVITGVAIQDTPGIRIYPVPASDRVTIETPEVPLSLEIISITGDVMLAFRPSSVVNTLNISTIPSGPYIIRMVSAAGCANRLLIIRR